MYVTQRVAFLQDQKIPINCKPRYTEFIRQILHGILTAQIQNFNDSSAAFIRLHCVSLPSLCYGDILAPKLFTF